MKTPRRISAQMDAGANGEQQKRADAGEENASICAAQMDRGGELDGSAHCRWMKEPPKGPRCRIVQDDANDAERMCLGKTDFLADVAHLNLESRIFLASMLEGLRF
jgi:hypothetical protein